MHRSLMAERYLASNEMVHRTQVRPLAAALIRITERINRCNKNGNKDILFLLSVGSFKLWVTETLLLLSYNHHQ